MFLDRFYENIEERDFFFFFLPPQSGHILSISLFFGYTELKAEFLLFVQSAWSAQYLGSMLKLALAIG